LAFDAERYAMLSRFKYYYEKCRSAWLSGTLRERFVRKILTAIYVPLFVNYRYARLSRADKRLIIDIGSTDPLQRESSGQPDDRAIIARIARAYSLAKSAQADAAGSFVIRGLWDEWIRINYGPLIEALTKEDSERAAQLLRNFQREQFAVGTGGNFEDVNRIRHSIFGRRYFKAVWSDYRDKLRESDFDLSGLSHPTVGNPAGISLNGTVVQIETLRHAYKAHAMRELLRDVRRPAVTEIGGGFGGQACQLIAQSKKAGNPIGKYLDFDIPEVQIVASYFLLRAFPEDDIRLFGEAAPTDTFAIGVFPHFCIDTLPQMSADLVFNTNSFSEMDSAAALHYLSVINHICRRYFMHVNHEVPFQFKQPDGTVSHNVVGSKMVPDPGVFKRVYKVPRLYGRPEDSFFKSYSYLYERMTGVEQN
jgi:putative sugar O-methyltransferase